MDDKYYNIENINSALTYCKHYKFEISGTTTANGNFKTSINYAHYEIVSARCLTDSVVVTPYNYGGTDTYWGFHCVEDSTNSAYGKQPVTIIVYCIEHFSVG